MKEKNRFFDLDDTLYDRSGPYLAAFRQFFGGRYEDKAAQAYQAVMHRGYEVFTAAHTGKISMDAMHIYRHQIGLLDVGIRITAAQALQLQAVYAAQQQRIMLSAAVRAALDYCREAYRAVGVITNGSVGPQQGKLRSLGLDRWAEAKLVFISDAWRRHEARAGDLPSGAGGRGRRAVRLRRRFVLAGHRRGLRLRLADHLAQPHRRVPHRRPPP